MSAPAAVATKRSAPTVVGTWASTNFLTLLAMAAVLIYGLATLTSSWDDSPAYDETEHVTSGYLCLTERNFRVNPWHPPLAKDLSAVPLWSAGVKPPAAAASINVSNQQIVHDFFFAGGNDPQSIIRLARMPMIASAVAFLAVYFFLNARFFGPLAGLFSLVLLSSSPTFLAHGRFVENDVMAAAAFFVSIALFVEFLCRRSSSVFMLTAFAVAVSQLVKFSLIALYPYFAILCICLLVRRLVRSKTLAAALKTVLLSLIDLSLVALMYLFGLVMVAVVYQWHVANLPSEFQAWYNSFTFDRLQAPALAVALNLMASVDNLRGLSWYLTGLAAQTLHVQSGFGMESYLLGKWYRGGNSIYFPLVIGIKESLAALALTALAAGSFLLDVRAKTVFVLQSSDRNRRAIMFGAASVLFVSLYMMMSASCGLNIGVRHVLPILPFVMSLTGAQLAAQTRVIGNRPSFFLLLVAVLLMVNFVSVHLSWPGYLSYYNEVVGGKRGGATVAVDSNCDWGTDLLRLKRFLERRKLDKVELLYFGKGDPKAYLGASYLPFSLEQRPEPGQWVAVSVTHWRRIKSALASRERTIYLTLQSDGQSQPVRVADLEWMSHLKEQEVVGDSLILFKQP